MITILGLALGALFLVIPLCVSYIHKVNLGGKIVSAFIKMMLRMGMIGLTMYYLIDSGSIVVSGIIAFAITLYYIVSVVVRARLSLVQFLVPVATGLLGAVVVAGSLLLFANISIGSDFCMRYVLPVVALLSGGIVWPMAKALSTYYMGLRHHNHLYYYLIGNGASSREALRYLQRRAIEQSMQPGIRTMATMAAGTSPVVMWSMLMSGKSALEAAGWQVLIVLAVFASSVVAVCVALEVARRYVVDGYAMLKIKDKAAKAEEDSVAQEAVNAQSAAQESISDDPVVEENINREPMAQEITEKDQIEQETNNNSNNEQI